MGIDPSIDITTEQRKTILSLLERHLPDTEAWVYGSRAKWTSRPQSDLDMVVFAQPGQGHAVSDLREAFEESDLPFRVDLFVWNEVPDSFRKRIEHEHVVLVPDQDRTQAACSTTCDWPVTTIEKISEKVAMGPFGSSIKVDTFVPEGIPIISGQHLRGVRVDDTPGFNFITPEHATRLKNANVGRGDVVFTHRGNIGQVAYIPPNSKFDRYVISQSQFYMRCDQSRVIPDFVAQYFASSEGQYKLLANASQVGVPSIAQPVTYLRTIEIPLPPLPEQRAIAHILGTLDDKIELNRRMNRTLEAMARALFKSWFVDFDPVRAKMALKQHTAPEHHSPLEGESASQGREPAGAPVGGSIVRQYSQQTLQRAQVLRKNQTDAEGLLWHYLRAKQLGGYKFRRQQPIGSYIVDFACVPQKLLIELDGGQHAEQHVYDRERDAFLRAQGYTVLRFWNDEVYDNCFGVLEKIYEVLSAALPDPTSEHHSPLEGESASQGRQPAGAPVGGNVSATPGGGDWTVERARAYLDSMDEAIAVLFPDALDDEGRPEEWTMGTLLDIAKSPKRTISPADVSEHTPYIGLEHMPRRSIALTGWESAVKVTSNKSVFKAGEILFGKLRPYFYKVGVAPIDGICSTDIVVVASQASQWSAFIVACLSSSEFVDYTDQTSTGTRMPRTSWKTMGQYKICLPSQEVACVFQSLAQPLIDRIGANIHETCSLVQARDLLLPKLISGEIRLRETQMTMESSSFSR